MQKTTLNLDVHAPRYAHPVGPRGATGQLGADEVAGTRSSVVHLHLQLRRLFFAGVSQSLDATHTLRDANPN